MLIGVWSLRPAAVSGRSQPRSTGGPAGASLSLFGLPLANPQTILTFAALLGGLGGRLDAAGSPLLVTGVLAGSASWWLCLTGLAAALRRGLGERPLGVLRAASGLLIAGLGAAAVLSALP